jgi:predicted DCC family thiol-disulfide oxidoreductase YuxK
MPTDASNPILLYDGVCGLCNRLVQFSLKRDVNQHLRFASLQSDIAGKLLQRHGLDSRDLDTVYVVEDCGRPDECLASRSDAVISVLRLMGGSWAVAAALLRIIPRTIRDWGYGTIARNRYRIFGKSDSCPLPDPRDRHRFLDV